MFNVDGSTPATGFPLFYENLTGKHISTAQSHPANGNACLSYPSDSSITSDAPGRQPKDVYDAILPWWRAAIRRKLLHSVEWESEVLAKMQHRVRTPWLDAYFVYTSSLGTHTFFMTVLPALFFFGYDELGRGLLIVLAMGVYTSSFVKDLVCSPRPNAPPVTRLTIGSHHLEYGFPSTHTTNSVSIALFFFSHIHVLAFPSSSTTTPSISLSTYYLSVIFLLWYTFSIVFGRLYTAMHGFADCAMGMLMGAGVWAGHWVFGGIAEDWVERTGWAVPAIVVPVALIMVNQHPQPVDDCPCFEDAIAFVSVVAGSLLARWHAVHWGFDETFFKGTMPGSGGETWREMGLWWSVASWKMVVGILIIFTWRIAAKSALHLILPPIFRFLAHSFTLPNRRFYTPATDYKSVPSEFGHGGLLRAFPSVIDLPGEMEMEYDVGVEVSGRRTGGGTGGDVVKLRRGGDEKSYHYNGVGEKDGRGGSVWELERSGVGKEENVKHYDADVLTKVIVYSGIAVLACEVLPIMFEVLGWGVKSW